MPKENKEIKISINNSSNSPKQKIFNDPIISQENETTNTGVVESYNGFSLGYIAKYIVLLVGGMIGSSMLGIGAGYILKNPLFFFDFHIQNILALVFGFVFLLVFIELIGIFFSNKYILMLIASLIFSLIIGATTFMYNNIFILIAFTISSFLVFVVFFIGMESDVNNQSSFKFFQSIRSAASFSTWLTFCLAACFGLSLISILGDPNYIVPDTVVNTVFGFVGDRTGVDFNGLNSSITDLQKKGVDISFFKGLTKNVEDFAQTPKEFVAQKLNNFVHSNAILISLFIALDAFFFLRFITGILSIFTKLITFMFFNILKLTGFFIFERVTKEAIVIKI